MPRPPLLLTVALAFLAACSRSSEEEPNPSAPSGSRLVFTDVGAAAGVTLVNVSGDAKNKLAIPENLGQGAAVLDFDQDGDFDIFIANGDVLKPEDAPGPKRCALYRNEGNWKFTDVTESAGLAFEAWCHGATAVDFDGDGWPDLYVTCFLSANRFFRNRGDGTFEDASETFGGADAGPSTGAAFFDADQDGDLDLYVCNYVNYDPKNPPNGGLPCFDQRVNLMVSCGPRGTPKAPDHFYENVKGRLQEATKAFGFDAPPSYALSAVAGDVDDDGDVDLYVANDSEANYLFENQGGGKFREVGTRLGVAMKGNGSSQAGMGVDLADADNDGLFDLVVTNFSSDYNTVYHNERTPSGRCVFSDDTGIMNLGDSAWNYLSWGVRLVDLDRNGWQDMVVVSGHVYPQVDSARLGTTYAQHNQIFMNRGPAGDAPVRFDWIPNDQIPGWSKTAVSRGLATADFDNDGDHDLLIVEMDAAPTLLRNDSEGLGSWVGIHLVGRAPNRDAVGARIVVSAGSTTQLRQATSGASYLSSSDPRFIVGCGAHRGPVDVEVRWPSGQSTSHPGLTLGQYHRLEER